MEKSGNRSLFDVHVGISCRDFVFWNLPKLQYRNPSVQVVTFKNMTPSPFIRCYFGESSGSKITGSGQEKKLTLLHLLLDSGKEMVIDVDSKNRHEIEEHLINVVGKTR